MTDKADKVVFGAHVLKAVAGSDENDMIILMALHPILKEQEATTRLLGCEMLIRNMRASGLASAIASLLDIFEDKCAVELFEKDREVLKQVRDLFGKTFVKTADSPASFVPPPAGGETLQ